MQEIEGCVKIKGSDIKGSESSARVKWRKLRGQSQVPESNGVLVGLRSRFRFFGC